MFSCHRNGLGIACKHLHLRANKSLGLDDSLRTVLLLQFFFLNIPPAKIKSKHVNLFIKLNTEGTKSSAQDQKIFIFKNKYLCIIFLCI